MWIAVQLASWELEGLSAEEIRKSEEMNKRSTTDWLSYAEGFGKGWVK